MNQRKKLFIALPCYSQNVHVFCLMSILGGIPALAAAGWQWHIHCQVGDGLVARCRNMLVSEFLATDCTDIFWLDDDVQFRPEDWIRIVDGKEPFLAGVYRVKNEQVRFPANWTGDPHVQENGYVEAEHVPFGFVRLRRGVVESMVQQLKPPTWGEQGKRHFELFGHEIKNDLYWGEDYTFCNKWRSLGGKVWVDPKVELTHHGITGFKGRVEDFVSAEMKVNELFDKALERAKAA